MNLYAIGVPLMVFCASFLGTWAATALNLGDPKPGHAKPRRFPIDLDQGIDLDELDRPTKGTGEL